ncbi:hypothetical protein [Escherichia coli]|uniref:hypothetical protein n=1 Tax=Escherichia coli TaxID=562 RepID=UPI003305815E
MFEVSRTVVRQALIRLSQRAPSGNLTKAVFISNMPELRRCLSALSNVVGVREWGD